MLWSFRFSCEYQPYTRTPRNRCALPAKEELALVLLYPHMTCGSNLWQHYAGKTHVICGILACLLHGNKFKRGEKEEEPTGRSGQGLRQSWVSKKRILVCAQSNSAIDELLGSLLMFSRF